MSLFRQSGRECAGKLRRILVSGHSGINLGRRYIVICQYSTVWVREFQNAKNQRFLLKLAMLLIDVSLQF